MAKKIKITQKSNKKVSFVTPEELEIIKSNPFTSNKYRFEEPIEEPSEPAIKKAEDVKEAKEETSKTKSTK